MRIVMPIWCLAMAGYFPTFSQNHDSLFLASAITKLHNAKAYTLKIADLMPEQRYNFRPTADEMNFGEQVLHISANLHWLSTTYLSSAEKIAANAATKPSGKDTIRAVVVATYDNAIAILSAFPQSQLSDTVSFFAGPMTKLQIINLLHDHQSHHRGQLLVYLRLCGIKPPAYVGW